MDPVSYPVRYYVPKPLQCKNCWKFGHSLFVCRSDFATCGKCGENDCEGDCEKDPECLLCKGNHAVWEAVCPKRVREAEIIRVRSKKRLEEVGKKCYDGRQEAKEDKSVRKAC